MKKETVRDPFTGLDRMMRKTAQESCPDQILVGTVLSVRPLRIRADGLDLDLSDLYLAAHLSAGWRESLTGLAWPVTANLPERDFSGTCFCKMGTGTCRVTRPQEEVKGETAEQAAVTHGSALQPQDLVLLLRSGDGQTYFMVDKLVRVYQASEEGGAGV